MNGYAICFKQHSIQIVMLKSNETMKVNALVPGIIFCDNIAICVPINSYAMYTL